MTFPRWYYVNVLASLFIFAFCQPTQGAGVGTVEFVKQQVPTRIDVGGSTQVSVTVKNVGSEAWTRDQNVALDIQPLSATQNWGISRVELAPQEAVQPGETKTFEFTIKAPVTPGSYPLYWKILRNGDALAGLTTPQTIVAVDDPFARATFVSQLLPDRAAPGEKFRVFMQFRNDGKTSWSQQQGVHLVAKTAGAGKTWGGDRFDLESGQIILPGQVATFGFQLAAPTAPGNYDLQWQLVQDNTRFFGDVSPATTIAVGKATKTFSSAFGAEFIGQTLPSPLLANQNYKVTVIFKNVGSTAWQTKNTVLRATTPADGLTWLIDEVSLAAGETVGPDSLKVFEFTIRTPADAGNYPFSWRLHNNEGFFGDASELVQLHVTGK